MKCLVLMPFSTDFDVVFKVVQEATSQAVPEGVLCYWLKDVKAAGRITDEIVEGLRSATFCIADVSGNNANVMWETGYAMAVGKPTILIGQDVKDIPFDLKDHRVLEYDPNNLGFLHSPLKEAVRQTLARLDTRPLNPLPAHLYWLGHDLARAIRLTMFEPASRVELEKNLVGALYHLERIEQPAPEARCMILKALAIIRRNPLLNQEDQQQVVGMIAQAKNDLGDLIARAQGQFEGFPSSTQRQQYLDQADEMN